MYSEIDLVDNLHQLLKRESDVSLIAASDPSGILWEWLFMPQWLSSDSATLNRLVTQLFRPHRDYGDTYYDDIFVHSHAMNGWSDKNNHIVHLRAVQECMRKNNLYANASKCIFAAEGIPVFEYFIGKRGLWAGTAKVKATLVWPVPKNQIYWRYWLGFAKTYTSTV